MTDLAQKYLDQLALLDEVSREASTDLFVASYSMDRERELAANRLRIAAMYTYCFLYAEAKRRRLVR